MKLFLALASLSVALVVSEDGACYTHVNVSYTKTKTMIILT